MRLSRVFLPALALTLATTAHADVIKCTFGQDYYRTVYDTSTQRLTLEDHSRGESRVQLSYVSNAAIQILGPGLFEIWSERREPVLRLRLNNEGRDGISEAYYPFTGELLNFDHAIIGGCSSQYLRATKRAPNRPRPTPAPAPAPTPAPEPTPAPAPAPAPAPEPTPEPAPAPQPIPAPAPAPAPQPKPQPKPQPAPQPAPVDPNAPQPGRVTPIEN